MTDDLCAAVRKIVENVDHREVLSGIENVVWKLITVLLTPDPHTVLVVLDVSLADQYGRHSPASKNVMTSFQVTREDAVKWGLEKLVEVVMLRLGLAAEDLWAFIHTGKGNARYCGLLEKSAP